MNKLRSFITVLTALGALVGVFGFGYTTGKLAGQREELLSSQQTIANIESMIKTNVSSYFSE